MSIASTSSARRSVRSSRSSERLVAVPRARPVAQVAWRTTASLASAARASRSAERVRRASSSDIATVRSPALPIPVSRDGHFCLRTVRSRTRRCRQADSLAAPGLASARAFARIAGIRRRHARSPRERRVVHAGPALAARSSMARSTTNGSGRGVGLEPATGSKGAVIVVGGSGGMSERYREIVEDRGLELRHFENRVPNGTRRILGRVAAVIVMVGHGLALAPRPGEGARHQRRAGGLPSLGIRVGAPKRGRSARRRQLHRPIRQRPSSQPSPRPIGPLVIGCP